MSLRLIFRSSAERDLSDILNYLSDRSPTAARGFQSAYLDLAFSLLEFPGRGAVDPRDIHGTLRRVIVPGYGFYMVYYRVSEQAVSIHRIVHTSRDASQALNESGDL